MSPHDCRSRGDCGPSATYALGSAYLLTVMQASDEVNQRRLREGIVRGLLESLFAKKGGTARIQRCAAPHSLEHGSGSSLL